MVVVEAHAEGVISAGGDSAPRHGETAGIAGGPYELVNQVDEYAATGKGMRCAVLKVSVRPGQKGI